MPGRMTLLLVSVLFFATLAKDITVPAAVLAAMALLRQLGLTDMRMMRERVLNQ